MHSKCLLKFHREISQMHENIWYWMRGWGVPVARTWIISSHGDYNFGFCPATFAIYANDLYTELKENLQFYCTLLLQMFFTVYFVDIKISLLLSTLLNSEISLNDTFRVRARPTVIKSIYILSYRKLKQYSFKKNC